MYLFSEKTLSDEYSVWWCGALTYLRTSNIFNQHDEYTTNDMIKIKEVGVSFLIDDRNCSKCAACRSSWTPS